MYTTRMTLITLFVGECQPNTHPKKNSDSLTSILNLQQPSMQIVAVRMDRSMAPEQGGTKRDKEKVSKQAHKHSHRANSNAGVQ